MFDPTTATTTVDDPQQRHVIRTLVGAQVLSGAGLAAGVSVGALLAQDMFDSDSLAGVPSALFTIGSAAAAVIVGRISDSRGRRDGLSLGYAVGALGAVMIVVAAATGSVILLLPSLLIYGAGTATNLQARYAGSDLASPEHRSRAVSTVLVATTLGAVVGPNAVAPMGRLAASLGVPKLAGPFMLSAVAYGLGAVVLMRWLRPDPLLLARYRANAIHSPHGDPEVNEIDGIGSAHSGATFDVAPLSRTPAERAGLGAAIGGLVMVVAQIVMVSIMTMTPVHMRAHGHGLSASGAVIAAHIAGMYLPSPITGRLVDRFGSRPVSIASGLTLALAGVLAATIPVSSTIGLGLALTVLGIGWNLGLLSGTALVTESVPLSIRARTQGSIDLSIAVAGATGGLGSGVVMSEASFTALGVVGAAIALCTLPVVAIATSQHLQSQQGQERDSAPTG